MNRFLPLMSFCFLLVSVGVAQPVFHIDSLPSQGVLLDKGWKFQTGDNPDWAKPDFDDSTWETIDPTKDIFKLPQVPKTGQIGWLRIHLSLDSTVLQNQLALIIQQSIASEYYLNGKLIQRFGKISQKPNEIEAFDPLWKPVSFPVNKESSQTLAIRFVLKPAIQYTTIFETSNPIATIQLLKSDEAVTIYTNLRAFTERFTMTQLGIWVMLFVLNFVFFLANRNNKSRFYFAVFALLFLVGDIIQLNFYILENDVANKFYVGNWVFVFYIFGEFSLMLAIYAVFERKRDWGFWLVAGYIIPALLLDFLVYGWGWQFGAAILEIFIHLNITRIAIIAVLKKKRSAYIIAGGAMASLFFFVLFLRMGTFYNHLFLSSITNLRIAYYFLYVYCIPVSAFIYLGLDFAFINKILKQKLIENETLFAEKQQILSTQNETLDKQVQERTAELNHSLTELKATQTQLIQREKMASLGELTAGIAHEIQNPLNFVNNFSEVSAELAIELKDELQADHKTEALELADDLTQNLEKITLHGRRASAIVKGMLEHSRTSTGERQPTDLNALADEYLRLAYQGLRAKNKTFNCDSKTDFDPDLGIVEVVPQDIGRVLLNLYNNAFYAVQQKQKTGPADYQPTVSVSTRRSESGVEIRIKDNGTGIPPELLNKIFQPFFTTKPTGEGTGLGLSLSYDIVTKGHGGRLSVNTEAGQFSEFVISLPTKAVS